MRADVLQTVAICCYGNAYLLGDDAEAAPELLSANTSFKTSYEVLFERKGTGFSAQTSGKMAIGTAPWLRRLRSEGVERLQLCLNRCDPDFSRQNASPWGITADGKLGLELWQPAWKARVVGGYNDASPWKVTYSGERFSRWSLSVPRKPEQASTLLSEAVRGASEFCTKKGVPQLALALDRCSVLQDHGNAELLGFPDLAPAVYPIEARQLFAATIRCMLVMHSGAWAPTAFESKEDQAEFAAATQTLWEALMIALEAGSAAIDEEAARSIDPLDQLRAS